MHSADDDVNEQDAPIDYTDGSEDDTVKHIKRTLIIEDEPDLAVIIRKIVEKVGLLCFHETLGHVALEKIQALNPDLVLLDINLPDMSGWRLLDVIKESKAASLRPAIIIVTAYSDPANKLMGKIQDVDGYVTKPFTPDELERVIRRVLRLDD